LVYDLAVEKTGGEHRVDVKMTLTAPGCGMGPTIAEDARQKIAALPNVSEAKVHIVWDPLWTPQMISPEGRKVLGLE
jgi:metal-sulfur cluster biosynthetic enzyme